MRYNLCSLEKILDGNLKVKLNDEKNSGRFFIELLNSPNQF